MTDHQTTISDSIYSVINTLAFLAAVAVFVWAFRDEFKSEPRPAESAETAEESDGEATNGKFVLGDLGNKIREEKKFTYPATLEEVEKLAQDAGGWLPNPTIDSYELSYNFLTPTPKPKKTLEEVCNLENTSPESNAEIVDAFQRIPSREGLDIEQDTPGVDYNAELYRHMSADVNSFNPLFFSTHPDYEAMGYTQIALLLLRKDTLEYIGNRDTIVSWESSADHRMDKIVIRDDLLWSDDHPITADDWEFSYNVIMTSTVPIYAMRSGTDLLLGVKAYDKHTLIFFHQEPTPISPANISFPIIAKHIYEKTIEDDPTLTRTPYHQKQEHDPVTSGQYVVEKHQPNSSIIFRRRENYYTYKGKVVRPKPYLNRVHFQISPDSATAFMQVKNGDIEEMALLPEQWLTQAATPDFYLRNTKASATSWTYFAFWFNMADDCPFFQDIRVRKALSMAFDYEEMLKVHRKGLDTQCRGLYAESAPCFPKDANLPYLKQDFTKARELLTEAGWVDSDNDGLLDHEWKGKQIPFSFTVVTTNLPESIELCNLLAQSLRKLGIECNVQSMEFNVLCQREQEHKFQMVMSGWGAGSDPYSSENIWGTDAGRNYISYSNKQVDELFKEGLKEFDRPKRMAIYQKIHELIYADYPCIWLFNRNTSSAFNKNLRGVGFDYRGIMLGDTWKERQVP